MRLLSVGAAVAALAIGGAVPAAPAFAAASAPRGATPAALPAALPAGAEADWPDLSAKLAGITGEWSTETYQNAIGPTMPDTAILGNGDVGVTSAGRPGEKTFIISKGDFWNGNGGVRSAGLGGVTLKAAEPDANAPVNLAIGAAATASSNDGPFPPSRAVSGTWGPGYEGWVSQVGKPQWLRLDLGSPQQIGRIVVRHDADARPAETANVPKAFEIQVGDDGTDWTTLRAYTGNTAARTELDVDAVTARYVRILLTTPTQESTPDSTNNPRARVGQVEVYAPAPNVDLAQGATATASSSHPSFPAARAVNGEWAAGGYEGWVSEVGKPQWLRLDLGEARSFSRYVLKHDAASRGAAQDANTAKDFTVSVSADGQSWTVVDTVTGNTAAVTDRDVPEQTARYVRIDFQTPTQESTPDSTNNPRARVGQFQLFSGRGGETPAPEPDAFHETMRIDDPRIDTEVVLGGAPLELRTWQGVDESVVVTEVTSKSDAPVELELSTWSGAGNANGNYRNESGEDDDTLWATRTTQSGQRWVSRAALATRLLGTELTDAASSGSTARGTFTLEPGATVSVVTAVAGGPDSTTFLDDARALAAAQDAESLAALAQAKADWWKDFWLASWVDLGDPKLERFYYGAQYHLGASSRPGHLAPGLYGIWFTADNPSFSGDMHLNYNFQAPWYGTYSSNRPDVSLPMYDLIEDYLPEAERRAAEDLRRVKPDYVDSRPELAGGADGVLFPVGIGPWGSTTDDQYWNQTVNGLFNAAMYIQYWEYTRDEQFLEDRALPYLEQVIAFFDDWLDEDGSGRLDLWAGAHEGMWGRNSSPDVPLLRTVLATAIDASARLGHDPAERAHWRDLLDRLAPTPTTVRDGQSVYALADGGTVVGNGGRVFNPGDNTVNLEVVHPAEEVNLHSAAEVLQRGRDTVTQMNSWGQDNAFPKVFTQAVRVGYDAETVIARLTQQIDQKMVGNLRIRDPHHGIEKSGATEAVNSMLLQSEGGVIDLFPVWPDARDAAFSTLRTKGAFLVSAAQTAGVVSPIEVASEAGGTFALTLPWADGPVNVTGANGRTVPFTVADGVVRVATTAGAVYTVSNTEPDEVVPASVTVSRDTVVAGGTVTVTGSHFVPGAELALELHSDPVVLDQVTVDDEGGFAVEATIPASTPAGEHEVVVVGEGGELARAALVVTAANGPGGEPGGGSGGSGGGGASDPASDSAGLASTGIHVPGWIALAVLLLGAGATVALRRRAVARGE